MTLVEIDERLKIKGRWGATLSAGAAWLYGGEQGRADNSNLYPSAGAGVTLTNKQPRCKQTGYCYGVARESFDYHRNNIIFRGKPRGITPREINV